RRHRMTAGVALVEGAWCQVVSHSYPVIEHEALTIPLALLGRHFLEIFKNAAFEVIDLIKTFLEHEARGFFTADAAGAEHGDFLVLLRIELLTHVVGKFAERFGLWIDRALEGADRHF